MISKSVRKFNAAITYEEKKNPALQGTNILPKRLNVSDVTIDIGSRRDFNKTIARINRFFKKGARDIITLDSGLKGTKYEQKELQYAKQSIKARKKALRKKYRLTDTGAEMAGIEEINISKKQSEIKSRLSDKFRNNNTDFENEYANWKNFVNKAYKRSSDAYYDKREKIYMQNFYSSIDEVFSIEQAFNIKEIIEKLKITPYQLFAMSLYDDSINIEYIYGADEVQNKYEQVVGNFETIYNEMVDGGYFE